MKPQWQAADRAAEARAAAGAWLKAGLVDAAAHAGLVADFAAAGPRLGLPWRVLVFCCVLVGLQTATVLTFISLHVRQEGGIALLLALLGLALAFGTEVLLDRSAFQPTGAEAATSLLAVSFLAGSAFVLTELFHLRGPGALAPAFGWSALVLGAAAWRWGFRLYAAAGACFALLLAAQAPAPRLAWIAAAALLAGTATALGRRDLAPSHRGGVALARAVALAALYVAVNYYSVDHGLLEEIGRIAGAPHVRLGADARLFAGIGSALLPLGLIAWGLRARDRILIDLGLLAGALSLATLRFYVHVAPLWVVLAVSGGALAGLSLLIERWLQAGAGGERNGFTAAAFDERALPAATVLVLAPEAREIPGTPGGIDGRGGGFGGGGAAGTF